MDIFWNCTLCTYQCQAGGWGGGALGRDLIDHFGLGVGHLNYLAVLGLGIFEYFVKIWPQIISRGGEFQLY